MGCKYSPSFLLTYIADISLYICIMPRPKKTVTATKKSKSSKMVSLNLPIDIIEKLDAIAEKEVRTRSNVMLLALMEYTKSR